jgi:hypothetical protein
LEDDIMDQTREVVRKRAERELKRARQLWTDAMMVLRGSGSPDDGHWTQAARLCGL